MSGFDVCALNTDSSLKDAKDIVFYNDPNDTVPLPPSAKSVAAPTDAFFLVILKAGCKPPLTAGGVATLSSNLKMKMNKLNLKMPPSELLCQRSGYANLATSTPFGVVSLHYAPILVVMKITSNCTKHTVKLWKSQCTLEWFPLAKLNVYKLHSHIMYCVVVADSYVYLEPG
ncbi:hypothetical protein BDR04DRAFT_1117670 [Suillus decipiens]|nr:hypothetical protein BDR04DRAFT_1117670 [Suillus decipiens]